MKIQCKLSDGNYILTLNNPDKLNCIGMEMLKMLDQYAEEARMNKEIKVVSITGAGEKSFSSGADLKEFEELTDSGMMEWIEYGNYVFNKIENLPKPTVALINGYAIGGGLELALCCDFRLGTDNALLFSPELKNGWLPGWGGMTRLRNLFGEVIAKEIVLLGKKYDAEEALSAKLLNKIFPKEVKESELQEFVKELLDLDSETYVLAKQAIHDKNRTTEGIDVLFDILALKESAKKS